MPNLRGMQLALNNNGFKLSLPKSWASKYPQSHYLLDEETLAWQKINWHFELVNTL
jgi:exopolyphosphatase/guanosine-5'-triphosphate,3'-diphosphate pyrophosphatase